MSARSALAARGGGAGPVVRMTSCGPALTSSLITCSLSSSLAIGSAGCRAERARRKRASPDSRATHSPRLLTSCRSPTAHNASPNGARSRKADLLQGMAKSAARALSAALALALAAADAGQPHTHHAFHRSIQAPASRSPGNLAQAGTLCDQTLALAQLSVHAESRRFCSALLPARGARGARLASWPPSDRSRVAPVTSQVSSTVQRTTHHRASWRVAWAERR